MSVLDDIKNAVLAYPHDELTIEIIEVAWPGVGIDDEDDCTFRFQVANGGTLNVKNLDLHVQGLNGTQVKANGAAAQWVTSFTTGDSYFGDVPAHQPDNPIVSAGNKFHFKPTRSSTTITDLVRVSVWNWHSDFDHIFDGHTDADGAASAVYSSAVGTN
jgi:hypothetical protein